MARDKKTKPVKHEELPELTDKQFTFVQGILAGKSAAQSYREAYDAENMGENTIYSKASILRNSDKVRVWLDQMTIDRLKVTKRTLEERIARMEALALIAIRTGNIGAAVQAEEKAGKLEGQYIERKEFTDTNRRDELQLLMSLVDADRPHTIQLAIEEAKGLGMETRLIESMTEKGIYVPEEQTKQ